MCIDLKTTEPNMAGKMRNITCYGAGGFIQSRIYSDQFIISTRDHVTTACSIYIYGRRTFFYLFKKIFIYEIILYAQSYIVDKSMRSQIITVSIPKCYLSSIRNIKNTYCSRHHFFPFQCRGEGGHFTSFLSQKKSTHVATVHSAAEERSTHRETQS